MTLHFNTRPEWLAWLADWAVGTEEVVAPHLFGSRASAARRPKADAPPLRLGVVVNIRIDHSSLRQRQHI